MKSWTRTPAMLLAASILATNAFAGQEKVLYSFQGGVIGSADGANHRAGVIFSAAGNLYGATELGGLFNEGTVFELSPAATAWTETQIFNFTITCHGGNCQSSTGNLPQADLAFDLNGNLYSTTYEGGKYGNGTVFQLKPPGTGAAWTENVLHNFTGDGSIPLGGVLVVGKQGTLLGTTGGGGVGCGVVFELAPPASGSGWTEHIVHAFSCVPDGNGPQGDLIRDHAGNVYGTTNAGGTGNCFNGCGTVFMLSPPSSPGGAWTETVLYSFLNTPDGVGPWAGLVRDSTGYLYGTTYRGGAHTSSCYQVGCGTVFQLSPPSSPGGAWTETVIYNFTGASDGSQPLAGLAIDQKGNLYGTASAGGDLNCNPGSNFGGCGVVFKMSPSPAGGWTETVLHAFTGAPDGSDPEAGLILKAGALYGTTVRGGTGPDGGMGTVFEVVP